LTNRRSAPYKPGMSGTPRGLMKATLSRVAAGSRAMRAR
jgi:hypothetical protein